MHNPCLNTYFWRLLFPHLTSASVPGETAGDRAFRHYCRGKLANAADAFDARAAADLTAAVKLDPSNIDAWNCLGECMWKNADLKTAKQCFESALEFSEVSPPCTPSIRVCLQESSH